ncbi:MAG TPA: sugar phosphate nucleotidyltransferase [Nitrososphaerales archaeon]|nr:sugar phosphate nucleotidyltransferase [Nitrososphaerales archaeon]
MQAVILAGGLGTRLRPLTQDVPKAMVKVMGRPFLEYEVKLLKDNGVDDLVVCVGYLASAIQDHFGDGGKFGVEMRYSHDGPDLLGPAGALKQATPMLEDEFLVTYGDAFLVAPYAKIMDTLTSSECLGVMAVFRNENQFGRSDLEVKDGRVTRYDKTTQTPEMEWINFGVSALKKDALSTIRAGQPCGEEEFYGKLISANQLLAYPVAERFYEIGTPESLREFEAFISSRPGYL